MTFGTKLKQARQEAGLSQEQLAEKLNVSRSAVAKWETDKGMPDIENLKSIAGFLNVSIDYLLTENDTISFQTTKEPINLDEYEKHKKRRSKKDMVVLKKFPNSVIYPLFRRKKLSRIEKILDWIIPVSGLFEFTDQVNNPDVYYLVESNGRQYLVSVSKEFITSTELAEKITESKFTIENNKFIRASYQITE